MSETQTERTLATPAAARFHYVLGFAFTKDHEGVLLIHKSKPKEQVGLLNGIGGKVEPTDTTSYDAMVREFLEETGLRINDWLKFATLHTPNVTMECFRTSSELLYMAHQTEQEPVMIHAVTRVLRESCGEAKHRYIPNLRWLIPMAMQRVPLVHIHLQYAQDAHAYLS